LQQSHDGRLILTASSDSTVRLWDLETGQLKHTFYRHSAPLNSAVFSPDEQQILSADTNGRIVTYDVTDAQMSHEMRIQSCRAEYSPDGRHILLGEDTKDVRLVDSATFAQERIFKGNGGGAWARESRQLVTFERCIVHIWDVATGAEITSKAIATLPSNEVLTARFLPDGRILIVCSGKIQLWNPTSDTLNVLLDGIAVFNYSTVVSSSGHLALIPADKGTCHILNVATGLMSAGFEGIPEAISPDDRTVITSDCNGETFYLYDIATATLIQTLRPGGVSAKFAPNGERIITGGWDGAVRVFRRRRPESAWGAWLLPECWLTVLFACAFVWSLRCDNVLLRRLARHA
jgi:WD40 repeat protein